MNSSLKKEMVLLKNVGEAQFEKIVGTFKMVLDIVENQQLQKYLYYPVRNYDFVQFVKKINRFCDDYNPHSVILKLAKKEDIKKVNSHFEQKPITMEQKKSVEQLVDKKVAKDGRKKVSEMLHKQKFNS